MLNNEIFSDEKREELSDKLYVKVKAEYEQWLDGLRPLPFDRLIGNVYDIFVKENIVYTFEEYWHSFTNDDFLILLSLDNTLETIWEKWNDRDSCFMCDLEDTINDLVSDEKSKVAENKERFK